MEHPLAPSVLSLACAVCGLSMCFHFDVGGEFVLGEMLLILLGLAIFIGRGFGGRIDTSFMIRYLLLGLVMLAGYALADVIAATTPAQYTRGWARVSMLVGMAAALTVVASHGRRYLWWFGLGNAVGILAAMLYDGAPPTPEHWKLGYGPALGLLLVVLSGLVPALAAAVLIGTFGFICVLLDSRSLGGFSLLTAGLMFMHHLAKRGTARGRIKQVVGLGIGLVVAAALLNAAMHLSDDEFADRRDESNVGRLVLISVGLQAVLDSPLIGYGSFAADRRYVEMMRQESARASIGRKKSLGIRQNSMLPHAQWLQAWIEGGLAGAAYFLVYGWGMLTSLFRLAFRHVAAETTALYGFLLMSGMWNLLASPFLGSHRVSIAMTVVAIGLLSCKKETIAKRPRQARAGIAVGAG